MRVLYFIVFSLIFSLSLYDLSRIQHFDKAKFSTHIAQKHIDFVMIGDSRAQINGLGFSELWFDLRPQIKLFFQEQHTVDLDDLLFVHLGDLVKNGHDPREWASFLKLKPKNLWAVQGNHDRGDHFQRYHPREIIDFLAIDQWVCIIGFNTEVEESLAKKHVQALAQNPKQCLNLPFKIWIQHRPVYSTGKHGNDELGWNHWLIPELKKLKIQWHFSGHDHHYDRTFKDGIQFVVSGGATRFLQPHWLRSNRDQSLQTFDLIHFMAFRLSIFSENQAKIQAITVYPKQNQFYQIDRLDQWIKK